MTTVAPHSLPDRDHWKVRRVAFDYAGLTPPSWHPAEPEFARFVDALSVSMPYLGTIDLFASVRQQSTNPCKTCIFSVFLVRRCSRLFTASQ